MRRSAALVAGATAVEEEHDLGRVGPALPEGELAAIGTLAVAARHNLLPTGGGAGLIRRGGIVEDVLTGVLGCVPVVGEHQREPDQHETVLGDLRFGETLDAVVTHAVGELDFNVERGFLLGGQIDVAR